MSLSLFEESKWRQLRPLRPRQTAAIEEIRKALREGHKRIVVQAPTGFGKTLVAAHMIEGAVQKGKKPLFTCPAITLVNQTLYAFENEGISDIGVIQAQHERTDWTAQVQIASVQTLIRRELPEVDLIIVDEVHQNFAKLNDRLDSEEWKNKIVIGLSATPWAKGMGLRWTKLIIAATVSQLIEDGHLSPFIIYAPSVDADFSKLKIKAGEFTDESASALMSEKKIVADVIETWIARGENRSTFLFAVDCNHAKSLQSEFEKANVSCGYIDANSDDDDRLRTFSRFRQGLDRIIASVGCLTTGVDEDVRCIIDAAPTRSEIRHVQKIGRGLRIAPAKENLIVLDHAGNTLRLGMVTEILHQRLDVRKPGEKGEAYEEDKEKQEPKPRKCHHCGALIPGKERQCPACGAMTFISTVQTVEGELTEYKAKPKEKHSMDEKQIWFSSLLGLAQERGKKPGWAAHMYRDKFGVWPNKLIDIPCDPAANVRSFEHSRRIAYAKSMEKKNASGTVSANV